MWDFLKENVFIVLLSLSLMVVIDYCSAPGACSFLDVKFTNILSSYNFSVQVAHPRGSFEQKKPPIG